MATGVNEAIVDGVAIAGTTTLAQFGAVQLNLATSNSVAHQGRMMAIEEAALGNILRKLTEVDAAEAGGLAVLLQQASKTAGNTP